MTTAVKEENKRGVGTTVKYQVKWHKDFAENYEDIKKVMADNWDSCSTYQIADMLNAEGYKTKSGLPWKFYNVSDVGRKEFNLPGKVDPFKGKHGTGTKKGTKMPKIDPENQVIGKVGEKIAGAKKINFLEKKQIWDAAHDHSVAEKIAATTEKGENVISVETETKQETKDFSNVGWMPPTESAPAKPATENKEPESAPQTGLVQEPAVEKTQASAVEPVSAPGQDATVELSPLGQQAASALEQLVQENVPAGELEKIQEAKEKTSATKEDDLAVNYFMLSELYTQRKDLHKTILADSVLLKEIQKRLGENTKQIMKIDRDIEDTRILVQSLEKPIPEEPAKTPEPEVKAPVVTTWEQDGYGTARKAITEHLYKFKKATGLEADDANPWYTVLNVYYYRTGINIIKDAKRANTPIYEHITRLDGSNGKAHHMADLYQLTKEMLPLPKK